MYMYICIYIYIYIALGCNLGFMGFRVFGVAVLLASRGPLFRVLRNRTLLFGVQNGPGLRGSGYE